MDKFTYLGITLSRNVVIDDEVNARLAKASVAFGRLFYGQKRQTVQGQKRHQNRDKD